MAVVRLTDCRSVVIMENPRIRSEATHDVHSGGVGSQCIEIVPKSRKFLSLCECETVRVIEM